jgi:pyruvate,orthophosphate dikinase
MIFGNLNIESGTGVVFTKNPYGDNRISLYGDYIPCSQGEDVVSGLVHTLPISPTSEPAPKASGEAAPHSLQEQFPAIFEQLRLYAEKMIETYDFPHQEIEFTFESPEKLFILQTRPQVVHKSKNIHVFDTEKVRLEPVGRGIGVGGGVLNGRVAFDMEDLKDLRSRYPDQKYILLRPDTVPDDIEMVFACDGLLTARGGTTSHAAVTAAQLGTVCVVNCHDLSVDEEGKTARINQHAFHTGDKIAIDGINGSIYNDNLPVITRAGDIFS